MKHALVTGTSSGIGRAVAEALLADGWRVQGTSRRRGPIEHERFSWIGTDLLSKYQAERLEGVVGRLGAPLDALIHAAGTYGPDAPLMESDTEEWLRTLTVNLAGTYGVVRACLPALRRSDDGRILP
jgi:NAD(P)-dependent dehydrogenase (short-subunit alcohol dehydrogenase family)